MFTLMFTVSNIYSAFASDKMEEFLDNILVEIIGILIVAAIISLIPYLMYRYLLKGEKDEKL